MMMDSKKKFVYFSNTNKNRGEFGVGGDYCPDRDIPVATMNLLEEGADDNGETLSLFVSFDDPAMLRKIALQLNEVADWMENTND